MNDIPINVSPKISRPTVSTVLSVLLYLIPVLFFTCAYFLITTSAEDILQGANTSSNFLSDALEAFNAHGRWPDMYTMGVINFFDYQYNFGIDTIFRIIDVILAIMMLYLATALVLTRRPRLKISDSILFCIIFLCIIISPFGRTFYRGFSMIHNYLPITILPLLFCPHFFASLYKKIPRSPWFSVVMLLCGLLFGWSSNITPIAFLVSYLMILLINARSYSMCIDRRFLVNLVKKWQFWGCVGVLIGTIIVNVTVPSIDNYASNPSYSSSYDYVSFANVLENPIGSLIKIAKHNVINFGIILVPLLLLAVLMFFVAKIMGVKIKLKNSDRRLFLLFTTFCVIHTLLFSQIVYPIRLNSPAYILGIVLVLLLFKDVFLKEYNSSKYFIISGIVLFTSFLVLIYFTYIEISYHAKASRALQFIKNTPEQSVCIDPDSVSNRQLPFIYLGQDDMLEEWSLPLTIHSKTVTFCH